MKINRYTRSWQRQAFPSRGFMLFGQDCYEYDWWSRVSGRFPCRSGVVLLIVVLCTLWTAVPSNLRAEITNRVVATVNSDIITLYELNRTIEQVTGLSISNLRLQNEARFYQIRKAVLNNLINEKVTEQQIRKLGIRVTERDIHEAIERVKRENRITQEEMLTSLRLEGITLKEYKERVKREIERARLVDFEVKSKIVITEEDVRNYYQKHVEQFLKARKVKLARILLITKNPADKAELAKAKDLGKEILRNLEGGSDFFDMAKAYSQGPAGPEGGCLGWILFDQLDPSLKKRIVKLSPGEYTEVHECRYGVQIVQLIEERKGGVQPFEEVREAIYSKIYKGKVEEKYTDWLSKLREQSFIKVVF
jgi:peptidyl-prolyl cis-trans isomerase SurA